MRVGVFGGRFDPPHLGHLLLAEQAREALDLGRVACVPAGAPPHKGASAAAEDRLEMTRLDTDDNPSFLVGDREVRRAGPSYAIDTVEAPRSERPGDELVYPIGADAYADIASWHRAEAFVRSVELAVAPRPGTARAELAGLGEPLRSSARRLDIVPFGLSSTLVRRRARDGRSLRYRVPDPGAVLEGPLAALQLIETSLLNPMNYPTLVATKAARLRQVARDGTVLDFGIRRGHERGVHAGSRAALIGGVDATSDTGLALTLGRDPSGTHAHSLVQAFMALGMGEAGSFDAYAESYPDDCLLLVDTVDTLASGVPNAIRTFERLRERGHEPLGIRLDSGDLFHLAIQSARMLNEAGFADATIVLSSELDEFTIRQIRTQIETEAPAFGVEPHALLARLAYGVGTRLITSQGDAALDGVYKLVRIRDEDGWMPAVKLSESPAKVPTPDDKSVWRLYDRRGMATADVVAQATEDPRETDRIVAHHPSERGVRRVLRPHRYHVSLSSALAELRDETVQRAREGAS